MKLQGYLLAALVAVSAVPAMQALAAEHDHGHREHKTIMIDEMNLRPATANISADESIVWLNYSTRLARISFNISVAKRMKCRSRTSFATDGKQLVSRELGEGEFASGCQLEPGSYDYEVDLFNGAGSDAGFMGTTMKGRIVVK